MRTPNPRKMVLRSDTKKLAESTQVTEKEGSPNGKPSNTPKMRRKDCKGMMNSKRSRAREDTPLRKKERKVYFQFEVDVIWDILLRLPIEALLRCRCVCKTWYGITKNPIFITEQMNISSEQPPRFICPTPVRVPYDDAHKLLLWDNERGKTRKMPLNEILIGSRETVFSHNGIICYAPKCRSRTPVVICNPITKERVELPQTDSVEDDGMFPLVGFCFVPASQKHVVVQISRTSNSTVLDTVVRFYILTSGERSWRLLTHPPCMNTFNIREIVYWKNAFHWGLMKGGPALDYIVSFDTIHETFQVLLVPDDIRRQGFCLHVLNGRLTLFESLKHKMKLWEVMGDKVGEFSLVCRETYDIDTMEYTLLSRLNKNENLLLKMYRSFVVASNDMKQFRTLKIDGLPAFFYPFSYNPSLASVHSMGFPGYHLQS